MNITSSHELKGHETIMRYLQGGHGLVTLESPSGKHYTYCFKRPKSYDKFKIGTLFAYVVEGRHQYNYVGMFVDSRFKHTIQSTYPIDSEQFRGAAYIARMAAQDVQSPMKLYHEGVCACCGRPLTTPESIVSGVGPICAKKKYM